MLPPEIWSMIVSYLDTRADVVNVSEVDSYMRSVVKGSPAWSQMSKWLQRPVAIRAARCNRLDLLRRLPDTSDLWTPDVMHEAIKGGHLEVIRWLVDERPTARILDGINVAAKYGHVHVLQWLHVHGIRVGGWEALKIAAENGHLAVVQWLHRRRRHLVITENAIEVAASNGHLHVIQWLHDHWTGIGCTKRAVNLAANGGHLHVIQWMLVYGGMALRHDCLNYFHSARRSGHDHVAEWLRALFPEVNDAWDLPWPTGTAGSSRIDDEPLDLAHELGIVANPS